MKHLSLFSGIGGFDIAAEWIGWQNIAHCEWNDFGKLVLNHHWENSKQHDDITKTDFTIYRGRVDIVTGGFPCQPYSVAGKRKGKDDERHLWPEMLRAIREIAPRWVVGENVRGIINWDGGVVFDEVQSDLEAEGYEILPFLLPVSGVNAPHERYRTWFVAFNGKCERPKYLADRRKRIPASLLSFGKRIQRGILDENGGSRKKGLRSSKGIIAHSNNKGNSTGLGSVSKENGEISEWYKDAEPCNSGTGTSENTYSDGRNGKLRQEKSSIRQQRNISAGDNERISADDGKTGFASNANSGREAWKQDTGWKNTAKTSTGMVNEFERFSHKQSFTDPSSSGRKEYDIPEIPIRQGHTTRCNNEYGNYWQNFPTQPPVCTGNDGFPTESLRQRIREDSMGVISEEEIDKILSSAATQWRKETIKAGGNAVVPPLVLQIFKAIQQYETLWQNS